MDAADTVFVVSFAVVGGTYMLWATRRWQHSLKDVPPELEMTIRWLTIGRYLIVASIYSLLLLPLLLDSWSYVYLVMLSGLLPGIVLGLRNYRHPRLRELSHYKSRGSRGS